MVSIRDLTHSTWTGMSTVQLLEEFLAKEHRGYKLSFKIQEKQRNGYACSLKISNTNLSTVQFEMDKELASTKQDAKQYIATKALYQIAFHTNVSSRMSKPFAMLWKEWKMFDDSELMNEAQRVAKQRFEFLNSIAQPSNSTLTDENKPVSGDRPAATAKRTMMPRTKSKFEWQTRKSSEDFQKYQETKHKLPVLASFNSIVDTINKNQVVIVSGETGSGKSTQIPQFLLEDSITNARKFSLVCTQVHAIINEPRRISATSLASRVSAELGDNPILGTTSWAGYQTKNDSKISKSTCINYCTTVVLTNKGILLRMMESDPNLESFTHIIVDEVHERTMDSDFLLLLLKRILENRTDLRVVLMSATANAKHFAEYFSEFSKDVPCLNIPGKTFPVSAIYLEEIVRLTGYRLEYDSEYAIKSNSIGKRLDKIVVSDRRGRKHTENYSWDEAMGTAGPESTVENTIANMNHERINYDLIVSLVRYICTNSPAEQNDEFMGSILIFMPGVYEIKKLSQILVNEFDNAGKQVETEIELLVLPLHGSLNGIEQARVFDAAPSGIRKVVVSTNVAETGITIPDAVYVIDTMRAREVSIDQKRGMTRLAEVMISKANSRQRSGRAGRIRPGYSYHLITKDSYQKLTDHRPPEAVRLPLEDICLKFRSIVQDRDSLCDLLQLLIDPPPAKHITRAVGLLNLIQALDDTEQITKLGSFLSQMPVDVLTGKLLIFGALLSCLDPILTICAFISSGKTPFVSQSGPDKLGNAKTFAEPLSDMLTCINAYNAWQRLHFSNQSKSIITKFCLSKNLNITNLELIHDARMQILQSLTQTNLLSNYRYRYSPTPKPIELEPRLNKYNENNVVISAALGCGLYPNVLVRTSGNSTKAGMTVIPQHPDTVVKVHNSSLSCKNLETSTAAQTLAYYSIQMQKSAFLGNQAVVWDVSVVPRLIYLVLVAKNVQFKPLQFKVALDVLTFSCNPRTGSVLMKMRERLFGAVDKLLIGDFESCRSDIDAFVQILGMK